MLNLHLRPANGLVFTPIFCQGFDGLDAHSKDAVIICRPSYDDFDVLLVATLGNLSLVAVNAATGAREMP